MKRLLAGLALLALSACASNPPLPNLPLTPSDKAPAFDAAIAAFEEADRAAMPPACATLFTGSSSIRFWATLAQDFPDRTVINRGYGGSSIWETNHYFTRIVTAYRPKEIVFYAGENDLDSGRTPEQVYADFVQFMRLKEQALGSTPVWFIAAKPSKLRFDQLPQQTDLNTRIRMLADQRDDLAYIDVVSPMLKPDGTPKDIFIADNLHMTPEGYAIWTPIVDAALDAGQKAKAPGC